VVLVDVRLGAALAGGVTRPSEVEQIVVGENPQLAPSRVRDRLALAGA